MLTFYFVSGVIVGRGQVPHFAINLFAGMVRVNMFVDSFNSGTRSIMQNSRLGHESQEVAPSLSRDRS